MSSSSSSPPQPSLTTLDEPHTRSVKSPTCHSQTTSVEHAARPQSRPPSPSSHHNAPPTPPPSSPRHSTVSTSTSMSAIQSKVQPSFPSQRSSTASISNDDQPSCLMRSVPAAASLRRDQPVDISSSPSSSGIVDPVPLYMNSQHAITPSFSFPGTSTSASTFDRIFPDSVDSHCTLATTLSTESISTTRQRTPNVYINGLPPHFSEQDLFALARPFGDIKSVRTFTRHVSEKPTGYGFVLFSDVDSAQRCIDGLRKHRNLHPSFSKQVHRIPGTEYAQHSIAQSTDQDESTFKARMEKLKDSTSTNLYIEGLPLSIDEESLAALVQPYKIKSSRFFKTKLSNPPRIIAFVRLDTRTAAEDTIERLHGRMVRGWNDPGCRISVRFADSAEQRELRRAERTLKSGDQSPSRLTIAQAALLNLRGQELQANACDVVRSKPSRPIHPRLDSQAAFLGSDAGLFPTPRSLPSKLCCAYGESPLLPTSDLPTEVLQSMQNVGYEDGPLDNTMRNLALDNEYLMTQQAQLRALTSAALLSPNPLSVTLPRSHTQAHNGFTPAEELILETHARRLQLQAQLPQSPSVPSLRNFSPDARCVDLVPHKPLDVSSRSRKVMFSQDALAPISEDDFHAMGPPPRSFVSTPYEFQGLADSCPPNMLSATSNIFVPPPNRAISIVPPPPDYEEPGKRSKGHHQPAERSTVPKQVPCSPSSTLSGHPSLLQETMLQNNNSITREKNTELQHTYMYSHGGMQTRSEEDRTPRSRPLPVSHAYAKKSSLFGDQHATVKEGPKSPVVVSPALTYSSRTPSTLSPATPFFGSFAGNQGAFEAMTVENDDMTEKRLRARVVNK